MGSLLHPHTFAGHPLHFDTILCSFGEAADALQPGAVACMQVYVRLLLWLGMHADDFARHAALERSFGRACCSGVGRPLKAVHSLHFI
jgi:hypothetical protein